MLRNLALHPPNNPYHFCGYYQAPPALGVVRNSVSFQCLLWVLTRESQCHFLEATKKGSKISCWVEQSPGKCGSCLTLPIRGESLRGQDSYLTPGPGWLSTLYRVDSEYLLNERVNEWMNVSLK